MSLTYGRISLHAALALRLAPGVCFGTTVWRSSVELRYSQGSVERWMELHACVVGNLSRRDISSGGLKP